MTEAIFTWSRRAVLVSVLTLSGVIGIVVPYLIGPICIGLFVLLLVRRELIATYREPLAALLLAVFAILALCFAITAEAPGDAMYAFNFVMFVLAGPLLHVMAAGAGPDNAARLAWLAFAGALLTLALATGLVASGVARANWILLRPLPLASTAILLGFLALIGCFAVEGWRRWLFLAGPPAALAVTVLTQTRGPLLTIGLLVPVILVFVLRVVPRRHLLPALGALGLLGLLGIAALLLNDRLATLPEVLVRILTGQGAGEYSSRVRLLFHEGAWAAFLQSPIVGHGWDEFVSAALAHLSEDARVYVGRAPHLHSDILDFAVAAGAVGLAAYLLLLATPLIAAWRSPRDTQREMRLFGAAVLITTYFGAGLTNLMFGFEFHTALYAAMAAILMGYCRDRPTGSGGATHGA